MSKPYPEFLPAVFAIQENPPRPECRYILWSILMFFTLAFIWACIGEVDIVGVAEGKIVPVGQVKIIQPMEAGLLKRIYVVDGQRVEVGEPLVELDTTLVTAEVEQIQEQLLTYRLDQARIHTVLKAQEGTVVYDESFQDINAPYKQIQLYQRRAEHIIHQQRSNIEVFEHELAQRKADAHALKLRIEKLKRTLPLISERATAAYDLMKKKLYPRTSWLELEQQRIEQIEEKKILQQQQQSLQAAIDSVQQKIEVQKAEFLSRILSELAEIERKITTLEQEQVKADKRISWQVIRAPVSGLVHQLSVHTVQGVVRPGQELMRIVPVDDELEIEAWVKNQDIGFIFPGQFAAIKIQTFPFTKYGILTGEVKTISKDAILDEHSGLLYASRIHLEENHIKVNNRPITLIPGMATTVEFHLGKRRLIEYLLSPLLRYRDEAIRER